MSRREPQEFIQKSDRWIIDDAEPGTIFWMKDRLGRPMKIIRGGWDDGSRYRASFLREVVRKENGVGRPPAVTLARRKLWCDRLVKELKVERS